MSDDITGRPSTSTSTPLTYNKEFNQQSHSLESVWRPFNADKSPSRGLGGSATPGETSQSSFNLKTSLLAKSQSIGAVAASPAAAATAAENSRGSAIASTATKPLDNVILLTPADFLKALPLSAERARSGPAATKLLKGPNIATPLPENQLKYGDIPSGVSTGGYNDLSASNRPWSQQDTSSPLPRRSPAAAAAAASSLHPPSGTPASILAPSANGKYGPDVSSSSSPAIVNKPVLKMKRTGQNFPLSTGSGSHHSRNHSYSSSHRLVSLPARGSTTGKGSDLVTKGGQEPARNQISKPPNAGPSEKLSAPFKAELRQGHRLEGVISSGGAPPESARPPANDRGSGKITVAIHDSDTDDIMYETAAQTVAVDGAVEDIIDNESSSDESDSQSEDDETVDVDAGEASFRQLFRAPDYEDDYSGEDSDEEDEEEEDEEDEEDDSTSDSSSDDSSIAEPAVALPSANIQHQEAYPSTILEMAEPGRLYTEYRHKGVTIKAGPALFPVGYSKSTVKGCPWLCAVRSCRLLYKTPAGLANHARFTHKKAMFNDNMDGTVSLVGSYSKKNQSGHFPPVVVSKRPLDPKEPPMREPAIPANKNSRSKVRTDVKEVSAGAGSHGHDVVMGDGNVDSLEPGQPPPLPPVIDSKSSGQMWDYIRPFLSKHKSLPETNWARHIIHLPRVRDIKWNEDRNREHPYKDSHPRDITALLVQVTGVESPTPCHHCVNGRGPFIGCIVISPKASDDAKGAVLSCANCYYHCGQSACSLCKDAVARRERRARAGLKPDSYNVKLLSDVAHRKPAKAMANQQQLLSGSMTSPDAPAQLNLKLYLPSEFKSIEKASSERTYKVIKGLNGKDVLMCGALIPEKYDLDRTVPGYPWICPIRSCRRVFKKIVSLGPHFARAHSGYLLNDNQDGTLSQVGYYDTPLPGNNSLPPLVISKNTLDPKEPPMEAPGLPGQGGQAPRNPEHRNGTKRPHGTARTQSKQPSTSNAEDLWKYMRPYLPESLTSISSDDRILSLSRLPRRREIQWRINNHTKLDDDKKQILGLIIYLTGEEHQNGEKSCTHCVKRNGPFPGCLTLTSGVTEEVKSLVQSCANCVFTHKSSSCSIKSGWSKYADQRSQSEAAAKNRAWSTDDENEEPIAKRRRSDRLGLAEEEGKTEPRRKIVTLSLNRNDQTPDSGGALQVPVQTRMASHGGAVSNGSATKDRPSSALIHAGQVQPDDLLEMEDWEIAPGRIRGAGADGVSNNIAFSKSYLEANQAVRVSHDVTFEVKCIKSGNNLDLEADRTKTRYCILASGKLYVKVEEQEPFTIGPHGLFKIAPGAAARVQNRLYIDSVLHISTYADG